MNLLLYEDETPDVIEEKESNDGSALNVIEPTSDKKESPKKVSYNYVGTLEIKSINLKRGFLDVDSPYNNVDRNVTVVKESIFPDKENSNLILVAHSGNCAVCYFDKLYKLQKGNKALVNYRNKNYKYELVNFYNVEKTGEVEIRRDPTKDTLTLITCTHNSDTEQTVYIFELIK